MYGSSLRSGNLTAGAPNSVCIVLVAILIVKKYT